MSLISIGRELNTTFQGDVLKACRPKEAESSSREDLICVEACQLDAQVPESWYRHTHSQENDSSHKGENEHETQHPPSCFPLVIVCRPQLFARRSHVIVDRNDVAFDIVCDDECNRQPRSRASISSQVSARAYRSCHLAPRRSCPDLGKSRSAHVFHLLSL